MIKNIFNCISIHNGGGITYLSLMHHEIDKKDNIIFLDHRAKKLVKPFLNAEVIYFKKNLFRNLFVLKERIKYNFSFRRNLNKYNNKEYFKEYYLNGIPPFFRFPISNNKVFILFQNKNLFSYLNYFDKSLFFKFSFLIYHIIHFILIKAFLKNTDYIIVQTKSMKKTILSLRPKNKIFINDNYWKNLTLEFYNQNIVNNYQNNIDLYIINRIRELSKVNKIFFYPSSFDPHKNHKLLFKTFNKLSRSSRNKIKLIVTIDKDKVPSKYRDNNLIYFIGNQPLHIINEIYKIVDFLLYPSLNESLGLPLIEASLYELPIIASNLDYVYDVCNPKLTFNPLSNKDLYNKIFDSLN
tara:strand:- start:477 stop:1535 length:1059 start_codon:yes stop_codon:yes gene_type:complete